MFTAASASVRAHGAPSARKLTPTLAWGAITGAGASIVMAMYAMIAAVTYQHTGFFTPMYHIAATVIAPDTMTTSMQGAMAGNSFTFALGPAVLGVMIHMMVGAMYGMIFAVIARVLRLHGSALVSAAVVWGFIVFVIDS